MKSTEKNTESDTNRSLSKIKDKTPSYFGSGSGLTITTLLFIASDILHFIYFEDLNEYFRTVLQNPSKKSILIVFGLFCLYTISLFSPQQRLEENDNLSKRQKKKKQFRINAVYIGPLICWGIMIGVSIAEVSGWSEKSTKIPTNWQEYPFGIFSIVYCILIFQAIRINNPKKSNNNQKTNLQNKTYSASYYVWLIPTIIIAEVMTNYSLAIWSTLIMDSSSEIPQIENPNYFLSFLILAPFYFYFFTAPRFTFLLFNYSSANLTSGLFLIFYHLLELTKAHPLL